MQSDFIARIIALVQKHGDRIVVADPSVGRAVVVLDLAEYERLRDASPVIASTSEAISTPLVVTVPPPATHQHLNSSTPQDLSQPHQQLNTSTAQNLLQDLTQEQLIDKINRDIGAWKTAQDRKRTDELKTALSPADVPATQPAPSAKKVTEPRPETPRSQPTPPIEDEERFFLEPIE